MTDSQRTDRAPAAPSARVRPWFVLETLRPLGEARFAGASGDLGEPPRAQARDPVTPHDG